MTEAAARRWRVDAHPGADRGLCRTRDSPDKFRQILEHLDRLQEWFQKGICPDEYPDAMDNLYGEFPTVAGQRIRAKVKSLGPNRLNGLLHRAAQRSGVALGLPEMFVSGTVVA